LNLKTKVMWLIAASVLATLVLMAVLLYVVNALVFTGYNHLKLQAMSEELAGRLAGANLADPAEIAGIAGAFAAEHPRIGIELYDGGGTRLYASGSGDEIRLPEDALRRLAEPMQRMFLGRDVSMVYEVDIGGKPHFVLLDVPTEAFQDMQFFLYLRNWAVLPFLVVPLVLIIVLPALFAHLFILWMAGRLRRLTRAMQSIDLSGEPVALEDRYRDEIGELTRLFNEMNVNLHDQYRRLRQAERDRTRLVSQLSHDLRTPLAIIKGYAETLQRGSAMDRDTRLRHATIILQKADYMNDLLNKLFSLARVDDPSQTFRTGEGAVDALLQTIMADYVLLLDDRGIKWHLDLPPEPVVLEFDRDALAQALRNLIDNAILHGGDGGFLAVRLGRTADAAAIEVEDRGKGIPAHKLPFIFDPFYRVDQGRSGDGLGVGLTIAAAIVRQHGGTLDVASTPGVRTVFRVTLPVRQDHAGEDGTRGAAGAGVSSAPEEHGMNHAGEKSKP